MTLSQLPQYPTVLVEPLGTLGLPANIRIVGLDRASPLVLGLLLPPEAIGGSTVLGTLVLGNLMPVAVRSVAGQVVVGNDVAGTFSELVLPPFPIPGVKEVRLTVPAAPGDQQVLVTLSWFGAVVQQVAGVLTVIEGTPLPPPPPRLASVRVFPSSANIRVAETLQYVALAYFDDDTARDATQEAIWRSLDPRVATISELGQATGVTSGVTGITATLLGRTSLPATLGVLGADAPPPPAPPPTLLLIEVLPPAGEVQVGQTFQFTARGVYSDGSTRDLSGQVSWLINTSVATISGTGLARSVAAGSTSVIATLQGLSGVAVLTVLPAQLPPLLSLSVSPLSVQREVGETQQFTAMGTFEDRSQQPVTSLVSWQSSNPGVAAISPAGLASALAEGTTQITAALQGIVSPPALLEVVPRPPELLGLFFEPDELELQAGEELQLVALGRFDDDGIRAVPDVTWASDNEAVATVDSAGLLRAVKGGQTVIRAFKGLLEAALSLLVRQPPPTLHISPSGEVEVPVGQSVDFQASALSGAGEPLSDLVEWVVEFDDTIQELGTGAAVSFAPAEAREYVVRACVRDPEFLELRPECVETLVRAVQPPLGFSDVAGQLLDLTGFGRTNDEGELEIPENVDGWVGVRYTGSYVGPMVHVQAVVRADSPGPAEGEARSPVTRLGPAAEPEQFGVDTSSDTGGIVWPAGSFQRGDGIFVVTALNQTDQAGAAIGPVALKAFTIRIGLPVALGILENVTAQAQEVLVVSLEAPEDGATLYQGDLATFRWRTEGGEPDTWQIQFDGIEEPIDLVFQQEATFDMGLLEPLGPHTWRVRAMRSGDPPLIGPWSAERGFTLASPGELQNVTAAVEELPVGELQIVTAEVEFLGELRNVTAAVEEVPVGELQNVTAVVEFLGELRNVTAAVEEVPVGELQNVTAVVEFLGELRNVTAAVEEVPVGELQNVTAVVEFLGELRNVTASVEEVAAGELHNVTATVQTLGAQFVVVSRPNLSPTTITQGEITRATATLRNDGAGIGLARLYITNVTTGQSRVATAIHFYSPGEQFQLRIDWDPPLAPGSYTITVAVEELDPDTGAFIRLLDALNFTLTIQSATLDVFVSGDITIVRAEALPNTAPAGSQVTFAVDFRNNTSKRGVIGIFAVVNTNSGAFVSSVDPPALKELDIEANETRTGVWTWSNTNVAPGFYALRVVATDNREGGGAGDTIAEAFFTNIVQIT